MLHAAANVWYIICIYLLFSEKHKFEYLNNINGVNMTDVLIVMKYNFFVDWDDTAYGVVLKWRLIIFKNKKTNKFFSNKANATRKDSSTAHAVLLWSVP